MLEVKEWSLGWFWWQGRSFPPDHPLCPHPSHPAVFCHATLNTAPSEPGDKRGKAELSDQVAFKSHLLIPRDLFWIHTAQTKAVIQPAFREMLKWERGPKFWWVLRGSSGGSAVVGWCKHPSLAAASTAGGWGESWLQPKTVLREKWHQIFLKMKEHIYLLFLVRAGLETLRCFPKEKCTLWKTCTENMNAKIIIMLFVTKCFNLMMKTHTWFWMLHNKPKPNDLQMDNEMLPPLIQPFFMLILQLFRMNCAANQSLLIHSW